MLRIRFFLAGLLISGCLWSSGQDFKWVKTFESSGYAAGINSIAVDKNGGVYQSGLFIGTITIGGQTLTTPDNDYDGYLAKYDREGNFVWVKHLTGRQGQHVFSIAITDDNHLLITGGFQQQLSLDSYMLTVSPGAFDFGDSYVAKLDLNGNVVAAKNIGKIETNLADMAGDLAIDQSGNILVVGGEGLRMFIMKLTPSMEIAWRRTYGYSSQVGTLNAHTVEVDPSGNVYVGGLSNTTGYLLKYNALGTLVWDQSFKGIINGLDIDASGDLFIGARLTNSTLGGVFVESGGVIGRLNSSGEFIWSTLTYKLNVGSISVNHADNNIYFSSTLTEDVSLGRIFIAVENGVDGLLACMDKSGRMKWAAKVGDVDTQNSDIVHTDASGFVYIGNRLLKDRQGVFQCQQITGQSQRDIYVAKIQPVTSVPINGPAEMCEGETGNFAYTPVSDFISYQWDIEASITWEIVSPEAIQLTAPEPGKYEVTLTTPIDLGCAEFLVYHSTSLTVHDVLEKGNITGPTQVCPGTENVEYFVEDADILNHLWSPPLGVIAKSSSKTTLVLSFPDEFPASQLSYIATGHCNSVEYHPIVISPLPMPEAPGNISGETRLCDGTMAEYTVPESQHATAYTWFARQDQGNTEAIGQGLELNRSFGADADHVLLFVRATNECGHADSAPLGVDILHKPGAPPEMDAPAAACASSEVHIDVSSQDVKQYHWKVTDSSGTLIFDETNFSTELSWTFNTSITIEVSAVNECGKSIPVTRRIKELTDSFIMPAIEKNCMKLSHGADEKLSWYLDGKLLGEEKSVPINVAGHYELRYHGVCLDRSVQIEISADEIADFIPNVITPNGDGKNQYFEVSENVAGSSLNIFNRWGRLVYSSTEYSNTWDGDDLPSGVYYYTIRSRCSGDLYKGAVTLIR